jgi:hypothetical protein
MNLIELLVKENLIEAKDLIYEKLNSIAAKLIEQQKRYVAEDSFEAIDEASSNIIKMGRIRKIRRRIRRNKKGKIVVQKNVRKSAVKGYRVSGNTIKRIPAIQRIQKTRKLKRYWKTKGRAKLKRTLMRRTMSLRRRKSMGIK